MTTTIRLRNETTTTATPMNPFPFRVLGLITSFEATYCTLSFYSLTASSVVEPRKNVAEATSRTARTQDAAKTKQPRQRQRVVTTSSRPATHARRPNARRHKQDGDDDDDHDYD